MLTLAFDTSGPYCAVALVGGGTVLAQRHEDMTKGQAERLMPMVADVLAQAGHAPSDLGAIGVGTGPGNFTGTRIAVAAARGMALGLGIPCEGVSAVEAYADGRDVIVCLPAPRKQVHFCLGNQIETRAEDDLPPDWSAPICGPMAAHVGALTGRTVLPHPDIAASIARIAAGRAAPGRPRPAPVYLRPADAAPATDLPPAILD